MRTQPGDEGPAPDFHFMQGYVAYRPTAHGSFPEAVRIVANSLFTASFLGVDRLLVDATGLTGFPSPALWERFWMAKEWAGMTHGLRLVVVARDEMIDPDRFGVVVARSRGLLANVFSSEPEAIEWLLHPEPKW